MRRARVLHAITMLELGGAQRNTLDTCAMLDRGRFEVGLACADRGELLAEARALADVRRYELRHLRREVRPWLDFEAFRELRAAIGVRAGPRAHASKAGVISRAAHRARTSDRPLIHGWGFGSHQSAAVHAIPAPNGCGPLDLALRRLASEPRAGSSWGCSDASRRQSSLRHRSQRSDVPAATGPQRLKVPLGLVPQARRPRRFVAPVARAFPTHFVLVGDGNCGASSR